MKEELSEREKLHSDARFILEKIENAQTRADDLCKSFGPDEGDVEEKQEQLKVS